MNNIEENKMRTIEKMIHDFDIEGFQAEVYNIYIDTGSKLRNTVYTKDDIKDSSTTLQKIAKSTELTKAWRDKVPVECRLSDYYIGDLVDNLEILNTNINERMVVAKAGAYALGRKTDALIINQFDTSTNYAGSGIDGLTKAKVLAAFEMLGEADVPADGQCFAVVGWKQWSDLLGIQEFASADYVGDDELPWKGTQGKRWMGSLWIPHSGLTKSASVRYCYFYHLTAVAHAVGSEVKTNITWDDHCGAFFINNSMSQRACLIDSTGVVSMRCLEV